MSMAFYTLATMLGTDVIGVLGYDLTYMADAK